MEARKFSDLSQKVSGWVDVVGFAEGVLRRRADDERVSVIVNFFILSLLVLSPSAAAEPEEQDQGDEAEHTNHNTDSDPSTSRESASATR